MKALLIIVLNILLLKGIVQAEIRNLIVQDTCPSKVFFSNPSFEDSIIKFNHTPMKWKACLNSPDTQPDTIIAGQPYPSDGNSYLGLIYIEPSWNEGIGQLLLESLTIGENYQFNVDLSYSTAGGNETYTNISIWLGNDVCEQSQLIFLSSKIDTVWTTNIVDFSPNQNYKSISIYTEGTLSPDMPVGYTYIDNLVSEPCDTATFVINEYTGKSPKLFPNPINSGLLTIDMTGIATFNRINIVDAMGRIIQSYKSVDNGTVQTIETNAINSGWYIILIQNGDRILARNKILILN